MGASVRSKGKMPHSRNLQELVESLKGMLVVLEWQQQLICSALENLGAGAADMRGPDSPDVKGSTRPRRRRKG